MLLIPTQMSWFVQDKRNNQRFFFKEKLIFLFIYWRSLQQNPYTQITIIIILIIFTNTPKIPHVLHFYPSTICNWTLPPNHSRWSGLDIDPTHFLHRFCKLREKTLHRTLQDLVYVWERCGVSSESRVGLK